MKKPRRSRRLITFARILAGPAVPFFVLPVFMVVLIAGTISQRWIGLFNAQKIFFLSPFGGGALMAVLALGLLLKFLFFSPWNRKKAGINLAHLGVLVLLIGGLLTTLYAREENLVIPEGQVKTLPGLPFSVHLKDFIKVTHPGIDMARDYSSDIEIVEANSAWSARIEMNKPLRYKGYTLFQSSFEQAENGAETSVLTVVYNRSWLVPYVGTALMAVGLLMHAIITARERRK